MIFAFDFETWLIAPGRQFPPGVCMSWAEVLPPAALGAPGFVGRSGVCTALEGCGYLLQWLESGAHIVGANTAFDVLVSVVTLARFGGDWRGLLRAWVKAYEEGRVHDVFVRQKLLDIAAGCYRGEYNEAGKWRSFGYNLADLSKRHSGRVLSKPADEDDTDHWRLRFGELEGVPVASYPKAAFDYALEDSIATGEVFVAQEVKRVSDKRIGRHFPGKDPFVDEMRQTMACIPLKHMSAYGMRTNAAGVERFAEEVVTKIEEARVDLVEAGLVRPPAIERHTDKIAEYIRNSGKERYFVEDDGLVHLKKDAYWRAANDIEGGRPDGILAYLGDWNTTVDLYESGQDTSRIEALLARGLVSIKHSRDTKAAMRRCAEAYEEQGKPIPRTDTYEEAKHGKYEGVSLDADACSGSEDPILELYSAYGSLAKTLSNDIPMLLSGVNAPVHTRFDELIKTGRTSSSKPNIQNVRRLPGIRECFTPRAGFVYIDCDFGMLELHTLAQVCQWTIGFSTLGEALNAGKDPHLMMAAKILGTDYDTAKARREANDSEVDNARTAGKGCFHPDTEVLTRDGWVRVGELKADSMVCSAKFEGDTTTLEYAPPLALTERDWNGELVHVQNEGIDLRLTPDHRMVGWEGHAEKLVTCNPEDVPGLRYWPNAGRLEGEIGATVDERLLRLAVAAQADGHIMEGGRLKFGFLKERKIARLTVLLGDHDYDRAVIGRLKATTFRVNEELSAQVLALLDEKRFPLWWTKLDEASREIVLDEVRFWDGSGRDTQHVDNKRAGYTYFSTERQNVEVLQTIATLTNRKTRLVVTDRHNDGRRTMFSLSVKTKHRSRGGNVTTTRIPYVGKVFCLMTHNDSVVVRDGGVPVITRQCNFGRPGGLSAKTFMIYAWTNYRIRLTLAEAQELLSLYDSTWVEMPTYFRYIKGLKDPYSVRRVIDKKTGIERETCRYDIVQPWSSRLRAGASYCEACNSPFQGLGSDVAKRALWLVWKATMGLPLNVAGVEELGDSDPLFDARPVNFVHDSIMTEVLEARAHAAAMRQKELMEAAGREILPGCPVKVDALVTRHWSKKSSQRREPCGVCGAAGKCGCKTWNSRKLIPWDLHVACREALGGWLKKNPAEQAATLAELRIGTEKWKKLTQAEQGALYAKALATEPRDRGFEYLQKKQWPRDVSREAVIEMFGGENVAGRVAA